MVFDEYAWQGMMQSYIGQQLTATLMARRAGDGQWVQFPDFGWTISSDKIDPVLEKVKKKAESDLSEKEIKEKQIWASKDIYYYFAMALMVLILWDAVLLATGHVKRSRKKKSDDEQQ